MNYSIIVLHTFILKPESTRKSCVMVRGLRPSLYVKA